MLIKQKYLFTPGPTPVPERVKQAMNQPMIGHRTQEFPLLLDDVSHKLMPIFGSANPIMVLSGSGTAALETAVANVVEEGDPVVVIVAGAFGDRFAKICEAYGADIYVLEIAWGTACTSEQLHSFLKKINIRPKAVIVTYCETSTGVLHPVHELGIVVKQETDALFIVDGVSCIGAVPVDMKSWNIDILVSGSQKALMLPPGLAFIASNDKAKEVFKKCRSKRFYLDLNRYSSSFDNESSTPFTPAISLIYGLQEVCHIIEEEGVEQVISRHQLLKTMIRTGLEALEIHLLTSNSDASPTVTAIKTSDYTSKKIKNWLQENYGISIAGGQGKFKGDIIRIGHMGYCTPFDVLRLLNAMEMTVHQLEGKPVLGVATTKAQEAWITHV
ncbi:pyridoxal-phosphate-dependent aminotransferase family protein [Bacillus sp. 2205SS5-2]|uniref:pyridoxal-phosphate-dependent aminotransferase family protein n=1 Tax=Bacillus sp. 2205SS5-2 TaxID=3109031 RepID=UPI0030045087